MTPEVTYRELAECSFPAELRAVPMVLKKMKGYFTARGMGPQSWSELEWAADEGLTNAVKHGCANRLAAGVTARWGWLGNRVWIEITDPSEFMPPPCAVELPDDILSESGRGGFVIARLTSRVEHRQTPEGHCLIMEKDMECPASL